MSVKSMNDEGPLGFIKKLKAMIFFYVIGNQTLIFVTMAGGFHSLKQGPRVWFSSNCWLIFTSLFHLIPSCEKFLRWCCVDFVLFTHAGGGKAKGSTNLRGRLVRLVI